MTFAQSKNLETCAAPRCYEPVEIFINQAYMVTEQNDKGHEVILGEKTIPIGYCLEHAALTPLPDMA